VHYPNGCSCSDAMKKPDSSSLIKWFSLFLFGIALSSEPRSRLGWVGWLQKATRDPVSFSQSSFAYDAFCHGHKMVASPYLYSRKNEWEMSVTGDGG
jgi:hypothetical protein